MTTVAKELEEAAIHLLRAQELAGFYSHSPELVEFIAKLKRGSVHAKHWAVSRARNYEPPQSYAQRTMEISAEDPDFA